MTLEVLPVKRPSWSLGPQDVVKDLREADSKGSFMRYAVIDMFDYEKVGR